MSNTIKDFMLWIKKVVINVFIGVLVVTVANSIMAWVAPALYNSPVMLGIMDAALIMIYVSVRDSVQIELTQTERVLSEIDDKLPVIGAEIAKLTGIDRVEVQDCLDVLVADGVIVKSFDGYLLKPKPPKKAAVTDTSKA